MGDQEKPCSQCKRVLPLIDFPTMRSAKDGHHSWCLECKREKDREYGKQYREKDPERKQRNGRRYARQDGVRASRSAKTMLGKYGLTPEMFAAKLKAQGGHCPFCPPGEVPDLWDIDHDHRCCSGRWTCGACVRDILCHRHNQGLGFWDDDPAKLRAAADYIERHRERIAAGPAGRSLHSKSGEGHQAWKGDAAKPESVRQRAYRVNGAATSCARRETAGCASKYFEWHLLPDADPSLPESYTSLCIPCGRVATGRVGGGHHNAVLTDEQAHEVRERYAAGGITQKQLAAAYGVSQPMISTVIRRTTYKN